MKKRFTIFALTLLLSLVSSAQDILISCQIIAYTDCDTPYSCKILSLFEPQKGKYVEIASEEPFPDYEFFFVQSRPYTIAPTQKRIAVQEVSTEDPLPLEFFSEIYIYDIDKGFQFLGSAGNALMAESSAWSGNGNKLLYWDAWGHYHLNQLDFDGEESGDLWPAPPLREMRGYVPKWSPSGEQIAVVGEEYPFPESKHALNDVQALYIAEPEIGATNYTPISDPERSVSWNFEWLSDNKIAYTDGRFQITTTSGEIITSIEGNYEILGKIFKDKLLIGQPIDQINYELSAFDPQTREFSKLIILPINKSTLLPDFNLSPDSSQIAYLDLTGQTLSIEKFEDHSTQEFTAPIVGSTGWWTPESSALLFLDYETNKIRKYDVEKQALSEMSASEMFTNQDKLPHYPNWLCPAN